MYCALHCCYYKNYYAAKYHKNTLCGTDILVGNYLVSSIRFAARILITFHTVLDQVKTLGAGGCFVFLHVGCYNNHDIEDDGHKAEVEGAAEMCFTLSYRCINRVPDGTNEHKKR